MTEEDRPDTFLDYAIRRLEASYLLESPTMSTAHDLSICNDVLALSKENDDIASHDNGASSLSPTKHEVAHSIAANMTPHARMNCLSLTLLGFSLEARPLPQHTLLVLLRASAHLHGLAAASSSSACGEVSDDEYLVKLYVDVYSRAFCTGDDFSA